MKENLHTPKYTQLLNQDGGSKSQGFLRGKFWYLQFYKKKQRFSLFSTLASKKIKALN